MNRYVSFNLSKLYSFLVVNMNHFDKFWFTQTFYIGGRTIIYYYYLMSFDNVLVFSDIFSDFS